MPKEEKMNIKELQEQLYNIGASIALIKMPAVIERIRNTYPSIDDLDIGITGEIITPEGTFSENGNGAEYKYADVTVEIDEFGMESRISDKDSAVVSRKNGVIYYDEPFDGEYFGPYNYEYPDNATPTLAKVYEEAVIYQERLKFHETLEQNKEYLLTNYPQTIGWFLQRNLLPEGPVSLPKMPQYSMEESENNRLFFYHNQINKYKTLKEKEDKKIDLLIKFAELEGIPASSLDTILMHTTQLVDELKESEESQASSGTVLEKGRKSLNYYKTLANLTVITRRKIKKVIIDKCMSRFPDEETAKNVMQEKMKKFFDEQSGTEENKETIPDR